VKVEEGHFPPPLTPYVLQIHGMPLRRLLNKVMKHGWAGPADTHCPTGRESREMWIQLPCKSIFRSLFHRGTWASQLLFMSKYTKYPSGATSQRGVFAGRVES